MECPRCRRPLSELRIAAGGGAYREAMRIAHACKPCGVTVLDPQDVAARAGDLAQRLSRSMLVRERRRLREACPACLANLERLTLTWDSAFVEVEECPRCGRLVLDGGELQRMTQLAAQSESRVPTPAFEEAHPLADAWPSLHGLLTR
jgi:Zn-finger nucleic acid-binding protein